MTVRSANLVPTPATARRLRHASGYIGLAMYRHATAELDAIADEEQQSTEVMAVRADLYIESKQWDLLVNTTRELSRCAPDYENGWIYQAYGLRELNRIEEAKALLLAAESRHGKSGVLNYNLACYHCLLGEMADARARLRRACRLDPHWKTAALDDPDLKAMRDEIAAM